MGSFSHAPIDPLTSKYLFIDGRYLWEEFKENRDEDYELYKKNIVWIKGNLGASATYNATNARIRRVYYYDCLDERDPENRKDKIEAHAKLLSDIASFPAFHIRQGVLKGEGERARQKMVDVQLAVDMLNHASAKNMHIAFLIAGDLDFKPVIESCIHMGVYVVLCAASKSSSKELIESADEFVELPWCH